MARRKSDTPRKKTIRDELHNARRRLRRQAERMIRDAQKQAGALKQQMLSYAQALQKEAEAGKKLTNQEVITEIGRLSRIREATIGAAYSKYATYRRNLILQQQLNAAGTKDAQSSISENKKDIFWMAVKGLWPNGEDVARNDRYQRILEHFYSGVGMSENQLNSDQKEFYAWLQKKGIQPENVYNDLSYVFEYVTEKLNDPTVYDLPEVRYETLSNIVITLR